MAVVPYSQDWQVILSRRQSDQRDSLVLYNEQNKQLAVHQTDRNSPARSPASIQQHDIFCPYCRRPFSLDDSIPVDKGGFMDSDYFKFLETVQGHGQRSGSLPPTDHPTIHGGVSQQSMNSGYYARFFQEQKRLGRGARGSVYLCTHVLDGIALASYAVKKVPIGDDRSWLVRMLHEVRLLEKLHHPNIVQYNHVWIEENIVMNRFGPPVACLMILMEYCNGGDLEAFIQDRSATIKSDSNPVLAARRRRKSLAGATPPAHHPVLDTAEIWRLFMEITAGLNHLHTHKILHRDLKAQNVLLSFEDSQGNMAVKPRAVISDFGEGQIIAETASRRTGYTGTIEWSAPEVILEFGGRLNDFTTKSDMWSLGLLLHFMIYERLPYTNTEDVDKLRQEIGTYAYRRSTAGYKVRADVGDELTGILSRLLERQPKRRPECIDLMAAMEMHGMSLPMGKSSSKSKIHPVSVGSTPVQTPYATDDEDDGLRLRATPPIIVAEDSAKIERIPSESSFATAKNRTTGQTSPISQRESKKPSRLSVEWKANGHDLVPKSRGREAVAATREHIVKDGRALFAFRASLFLLKMATIPSGLAHPVWRYALILLALRDFYDSNHVSFRETTVFSGIHFTVVALLFAAV